jgi:hypothetical protein
VTVATAHAAATVRVRRVAAAKKKQDVGRRLATQASEETGAHAPVFFRPHFGRTQNFTMWKIFLPRKKSCCVAQRGLLQQGKLLFSMRNVYHKYLILKNKKSQIKLILYLLRVSCFA